MAERYLICPLCGFEFEAQDAVCAHGCPMRSHCADGATNAECAEHDQGTRRLETGPGATIGGHERDGGGQDGDHHPDDAVDVAAARGLLPRESR